MDYRTSYFTTKIYNMFIREELEGEKGKQIRSWNQQTPISGTNRSVRKGIKKGFKEIRINIFYQKAGEFGQECIFTFKIRFYVPIFHISAFTLIPERKGYVYVQQGKM